MILEQMSKDLKEDKVKLAVNAGDSFGNTVAHLAVFAEQNNMLALLEKYGCDCTLKNKAGDTVFDVLLK